MGVVLWMVMVLWLGGVLWMGVVLWMGGILWTGDVLWMGVVLWLGGILWMGAMLWMGVTFLPCPCTDQASKKHPFPCPTTYRAALTSYVDISSTPRTHVLHELVEYTSDPAEREFLLKITSPTIEGKASKHCLC